MKIEHKGKERELKFTFNSFKYMQDFDLGELATLESKPFKILGISESLLIGAMNHNPKEQVSYEEVSEYLEYIIEEGNISELLEELIGLLNESSFFKNLQKTKSKKKK